MIDNEMLQAIGSLFDEKIRTAIKEELEPINKRLDSMDNRLGLLEVKADTTHRKIGDLDFKFESVEFKMKEMERSIKRDIHLLNDAQETLITIMELKGILPKVEGQ